MTDFENLDISTAKECLKKKEFSSLELTKFFIERIEKSDLNCFITHTFENAIEMAKKSDIKISRNKEIKTVFFPSPSHRQRPGVVYMYIYS